MTIFHLSILHKSLASRSGRPSGQSELFRRSFQVATVGFLGLGIMGAPMAQRLIGAGHRLTVWSHTIEKAARFASLHNCALGNTPAEGARANQTVFLCVRHTAMSREPLFGEER